MHPLRMLLEPGASIELRLDFKFLCGATRSVTGFWGPISKYKTSRVAFFVTLSIYQVSGDIILILNWNFNTSNLVLRFLVFQRSTSQIDSSLCRGKIA